MTIAAHVLMNTISYELKLIAQIKRVQKRNETVCIIIIFTNKNINLVNLVYDTVLLTEHQTGSLNQSCFESILN